MTPAAPGSHPWTIAAFLIYLVLMVAIGIVTVRFSSSGIGAFFLGGRRMKSFVVALSAVTSGRSAWLLIGMSGLAFTRGVSAVWAVVGYILMELFLFLYAGRRLRCFTGRMDDITVPDFLESRFEDRTHALRVIAAVPILIFMTAYLAAQFTAGGKSLATSFGLSPLQGLLLTAGIVVFYSVAGGFLAVCITDMLMGLFMIFALMILPAISILHLGGFGVLLETLQAFSPRLIDPFAISAGALIGYVGIGLGSPGNPHILNRYMSIDKPENLRKTGLIGTVWNVFMSWGAVYIGLAGRALYGDVSALPGADPENIYPLLASEHLHPFLFGLTIAAVVAAIMSTASSQLLVAGSTIVRDLYQKTLAGGRIIAQKKLVFLSRAATLIIAVIALVFGAFADKLVFYLVLFAWGGLGAAFGPTILLSLYWKKVTRAGAIAGVFTGTAVQIAWYLTPSLKAVIAEWVPAFFMSLAAVVAVSLATTPPAGIERLMSCMREDE